MAAPSGVASNSLLERILSKRLSAHGGCSRARCCFPHQLAYTVISDVAVGKLLAMSAFGGKRYQMGAGVPASFRSGGRDPRVHGRDRELGQRAGLALLWGPGLPIGHVSGSPPSATVFTLTRRDALTLMTGDGRTP